MWHIDRSLDKGGGAGAYMHVMVVQVYAKDILGMSQSCVAFKYDLSSLIELFFDDSSSEAEGGGEQSAAWGRYFSTMCHYNWYPSL